MSARKRTVVARVRRPARFTQADVARAVRGAKRADLSIAEVRIEPDGAIVIIHGEPHSAAQSSKFTDWDEDLSSRSLVMSMSDGIATAATSIGISGAFVVYGNCRVSRSLRNLRRSTNA